MKLSIPDKMSNLLLLASACERIREQDALEDEQNHGRGAHRPEVKHWRKKQILNMDDPLLMSHFSVTVSSENEGESVSACQWCFYRDPWSGCFMTPAQMRNHLIHNHVMPAPNNSTFR